MRRHVRVYRNLHTRGFSVQEHNRATGHWRVTDRVSDAVMFDCTFKVSEAGRQRVLRDKRKNVHAYVLADRFYAVDVFREVMERREVTYNPYSGSGFYYVDTGDAAEVLPAALICDGKLYELLDFLEK